MVLLTGVGHVATSEAVCKMFLNQSASRKSLDGYVTGRYIGIAESLLRGDGDAVG